MLDSGMHLTEASMSITYLFYRVGILSVDCRGGPDSATPADIEPKRQSYTSTMEVNNVKR